MKYTLMLLFLFFSSFGLTKAQNIFDLPENPIQTRWASAENWKGEKGRGGMIKAGRKGSPSFDLKAGMTKTLARVTNSSGMVRRIWLTISNRTPEILRGVKIEIYWDDAETPAISVPIGDFFGHGLAQMKKFENALFASPEGKSFLCFAQMPFSKGMRINIVNTTDKEAKMVFYDVNYTLGDKFDKNSLYFHAYFNHQPSTTLTKDYEVLPKVKGKGRFIGANFSVIPNKEEYTKAWWGEGEVKMYLDGDTDYPTLCGTGTEDYISTAWSLGEFSNQFSGCTIADEQKYQYAFYRFHIPDPVYFYNDIKVSIQQIGYTTDQGIVTKMSNMKTKFYQTTGKNELVDFTKENKYLFFERSDDYASCSYFYLSTPENGLPIIQINK